MERMSTRFRSIKNPHPPSSPADKRKEETASSSSSPALPQKQNGGTKDPETKRASAWSVYLIVSSRLPKTYVGVTTNIIRRLKQHNGELRGGAKASSSGRPWVLACIIQGFKDQSEACVFESKWKGISRKMPRKKKEGCALNSLLEHREAALNRLRASFDCSFLQVEWQSISS
ncbi:structure-specific endonuclease subunit SLX1 homolog [Phoenix dactylifera]|uniref:Structure-specific endonuclease subunit SLX1 homolog n=1 Tax=Phoenix dactylifera TaxID=42345 RepID=A0A8B9ABP9_PHODC|nr:structure-specific endonuclease subunit SLX1 homolog [Phoenix dactylifera]XP_038980639.1 structure-specific endonuclease subunit SLX1 homolog [Phoenix dactylifera]